MVGFLCGDERTRTLIFIYFLVFVTREGTVFASYRDCYHCQNLPIELVPKFFVVVSITLREWFVRDFGLTYDDDCELLFSLKELNPYRSSMSTQWNVSLNSLDIGRINSTQEHGRNQNKKKQMKPYLYPLVVIVL